MWLITYKNREYYYSTVFSREISWCYSKQTSLESPYRLCNQKMRDKNSEKNSDKNSCIRDTWWGADPTTMLLYKTLIRSRIEYGDYFVSPCKSNLFYRLEKCLRMAMGYRIPNQYYIQRNQNSAVC